jgi:nicotinate-nucleotide--dimethylbenzimidazole phosphoribosyltransferase
VLGGAIPGTLGRRLALISSALALYQPCFVDPIGILAAVGGCEIATMAGFLPGCAAERRAVAVDGFITCAAVLAARAVSPDVTACLFYVHDSTEHAHDLVLRRLGAWPILNPGVRLGEGSGAAFVLGRLTQTHGLYSNLASFEQADVAESTR